MPCRLATAATGSRSASRMIATICSSVNLDFRIAPSESGASLSRNQWSEIPQAGQRDDGLFSLSQGKIGCKLRPLNIKAMIVAMTDHSVLLEPRNSHLQVVNKT